MYTNPADETIRMPLRVKGRDVILHDRFVAAAAFRREHIEVIGAAVRFTIALMEPILPKLLSALSAKEVLRVPSLL